MQVKLKRILVTTDFSAPGDHALGYAFRIAADHGAEVLLCHVIEEVPPPNPFYAHYYPTELLRPDLRERAENDARRTLLKRVPKDRFFARVPHTVLISHGKPVDEILRVARKHKVNLLVISTHGRKGLERVVLGSVAERVIRHAHCPVLVVR